MFQLGGSGAKAFHLASTELMRSIDAITGWSMYYRHYFSVKKCAQEEKQEKTPSGFDSPLCYGLAAPARREREFCLPSVDYVAQHSTAQLRIAWHCAIRSRVLLLE